MELPQNFISLFRQFLLGSNQFFPLDKVGEFMLAKNGFGFRYEGILYHFNYHTLTSRPVDELIPLDFSQLSLDERHALYWSMREINRKAYEAGLENFFMMVFGVDSIKKRKEPITYSPEDIADLAHDQLWKIVAGKSYPFPLPSDIEPWYVYLSDWGHSVIAIDSLTCHKSADPSMHMIPVPVKTLLRQGYIMRYGMVYSPFDCHEEDGLLILEGDQEL